MDKYNKSQMMGKIAVIHPDLGVGGAERLIVDASKALQDVGHDVTIYTGYHDRDRCFKETIDGTLKTLTIGSWIPRALFDKFHALFAYLKMIYIAIHLLMFSKYDLILCDQISACVPVFRLDLFKRTRVIFYCHFPDQLLTQRETTLKRIYRMPIDFIEEYSINCADTIVVNSQFTSSVVKRTFKRLKNRPLTVLYPCVDVNAFTKYRLNLLDCSNSIKKLNELSKTHYIFLSLNRFERKKKLTLAIEAMCECLEGFEEQENQGKSFKVHLVVAGGYDERLKDCVEYYKELEQRVTHLELDPYVTFVKSPSDNEKMALLKLCNVVVYTPENEHFGIVPIEAMAMSKPVIASATGGPLETIENEVTGILCETDEYAFAEAMLRLANSFFSKENLSETMGAAGLNRVKQKFSYEAFRANLNEICFLRE